MHATLISTDQGFSVQGHVGFFNVVRLRFEGTKLLKKFSQENIAINLSEMKDQDASSLSLLLCWLRFAKKNKKSLQFINLSHSLQRMSKMFGLVWIN
ncbi:MAG TPA: hypothetical protein VJK30_04075 [Coxiellaceae bacterium]|nr:MAG: hypothetical protein A3E81_06685 [Gammaproteobacteria bacterium RIFCSPHIGHO2_12_FULL_36_30]HLB56486.1 hypothetical protein [Coxiellaceae bacterium]